MSSQRRGPKRRIEGAKAIRARWAVDQRQINEDASADKCQQEGKQHDPGEADNWQFAGRCLNSLAD